MKTVMKYHKILSNELNTEIEIFRASEIISEDRILKAVFITNGSSNDALVSYYIKSNGTYNLIPVNTEVLSAGRTAVIQKGLIFNDDDIVCFKSNKAGVDVSLDIVYDNEAV